MKVYIAGPMQGIANFNFPMFNGVAQVLRGRGHSCFNPAERDIQRHGGVDISVGNEHGDVKVAEATHGFNLREAMCDDTRYICMDADTILLLPGWEGSKSAFAEWALAKCLGLRIIYWSEYETMDLLQREAA